MEEWKTISGYPNYQISNQGRVKNMKYDRIIGTRSTTGYACVQLGRCSQKKYIHRLVADAFIPKIPGKDSVDHIDRNRLNNNINNLRWADSSDQNRNKNIIPGILNEKYIFKTRSNTYRVNFIFKNLQDATQFRDTTLALFPKTIDGVWDNDT
jgi:hypothetical protein